MFRVPLLLLRFTATQMLLMERTWPRSRSPAPPRLGTATGHGVMYTITTVLTTCSCLSCVLHATAITATFRDCGSGDLP